MWKLKNQLKHLLRRFGTAQDVLIGKSIIQPDQLSSEDIMSLIWTCLDIKTILSKGQYNLHLLKGKRICLLLTEGDYKKQTMISKTASMLGMDVTTVIDPKFEKCEYICDIGHLISFNSDIILVSAKSHRKLIDMAGGSTVPILNLRSCKFIIPQAINVLVILQEKFGYLNNLNIGFIGLPCPLFNTYLCIMPKVGLNIGFLNALNKDENITPLQLPTARALSKSMNTKLHQYVDRNELLQKADVIITSRYPVPKLKITLHCIETTCKQEWKFLMNLPRSSSEVEDKVFEQRNSLVSDSIKNEKYTYAALILRLLTLYEHTIPYPKFSKDNNIHPKENFGNSEKTS